MYGTPQQPPEQPPKHPYRAPVPPDGTRLLPWRTPDGKPCYLRTGEADGDDGPGFLAQLADNLEEEQLANAAQVAGGARALLADGECGEQAVRFALRRSVESLGEVLWIADGRAARISVPGISRDG